MGEFAAWVYETRGNSKIFEFKGETEGENTSAKIESRVELQDGGTPRRRVVTFERTQRTKILEASAAGTVVSKRQKHVHVELWWRKKCCAFPAVHDGKRQQIL